MSTNFSLTTASPQVNVIQSINYLLATQPNIAAINSNANIILNGNILYANTVTGQIYSNNAGTIGYVQGYIDVKYANNATGSSGFSSNSAYANYYGVHNSATATIDNNPVDYQWTQVAGGFGNTKQLYYTTGGGNTISFYVGTSAPTYYQVVLDNTPILLANISVNRVNTPQLVNQAATSVITVSANPTPTQILWTNGNTTQPNAAGYLWPSYTRGFVVPGGATITPATTGSSTGSQIQVNYNTYLNTLGNSTITSSNLVELWKSQSSSYYATYFEEVRWASMYQNGNNSNAAPVFDAFSLVGLNGSQAYVTANVGQTPVVTIVSGGVEGATNYNTSTPYWVYNNPGTGGVINYLYGSAISTTAMPGINYTHINPQPAFSVYGSVSAIYSSSPFTNQYIYTYLCGSSGRILKFQQNYTPYPYSFDNTGTFNDLQAIAQATSPLDAYPYGTPAMVAVGGVGTILKKDTNIYGNLSVSDTWTPQTSNTTQNLNDVACNWTPNIAVPPNYLVPPSNINPAQGTNGNLWVAVGNGGTILYSTGSDPGSWVKASVVPTTNNLYGVGYAQGQWIAVGASGTIISSTDGNVWTGPYTNPADGSNPTVGTRDYTSVAGGPVTGRFVAVGQGIISTTANTLANSWQLTYDAGTAVTSTLTRLQYYGSGANIANVSQPPAQQQISNAQVISGTYSDVNYTAGTPVTYYLVAGNMTGNANVYVSGSSIIVTEIKR